MSPAIDLTCGGDVDNDVDGGDDDGAIDLTFGGGHVDGDDDDGEDDGDIYIMMMCLSVCHEK